MTPSRLLTSIRRHHPDLAERAGEELASLMSGHDAGTESLEAAATAYVEGVGKVRKGGGLHYIASETDRRRRAAQEVLRQVAELRLHARKAEPLPTVAELTGAMEAAGYEVLEVVGLGEVADG